MKKTRLFLSALVVFAVVGSALAFKPLEDGSIFCEDDGTECDDRQPYRVQQGGNIIDPCNGPEYIDTGSDCVLATGPFVETAPGK